LISGPRQAYKNGQTQLLLADARRAPAERCPTTRTDGTLPVVRGHAIFLLVFNAVYATGGRGRLRFEGEPTSEMKKRLAVIAASRLRFQLKIFAAT
jgi:hypothetical protein